MTLFGDSRSGFSSRILSKLFSLPFLFLKYQTWLGRISSATTGGARQLGESSRSFTDRGERGDRGQEDQRLDFSRISDIPPREGGRSSR